MLRGSAAKRYAQAATAIAAQTGAWTQWRQDLDTIVGGLGDGPLLHILQAPRVPLARKVAIVDELFGDRVAPQVMHLVYALLRRRHITQLPQVRRWFSRLADQAEGIERYTVTSAVPLSDDIREALHQRLGRDSTRVIVTERVDPAIIGGLVVRHEDLVRDYSIRARLEALREQLAGGS